MADVSFDLDRRWPEPFDALDPRDVPVVVNALASAWQEGAAPDREDVENLTDAVRGAIDAAEYARRVAGAAERDRATAPGRTDRAETGTLLLREVDLVRGTVPVDRTFDAEHLRAIHAHLFGGLHPWAGVLRTTPASKGTNPVGFASPERIRRYLADAHGLVGATDWAAVDHEGFARAAGTVYAYVNQAHPFVAGNGQAAKVFLGQVAELSPFRVHYALVPREVWNQASELAGPDLGRYEPVPDTLVDVFRAIARPAVAA